MTLTALNTSLLGPTAIPETRRPTCPSLHVASHVCDAAATEGAPGVDPVLSPSGDETG